MGGEGGDAEVVGTQDGCGDVEPGGGAGDVLVDEMVDGGGLRRDRDFRVDQARVRRAGEDGAVRGEEDVLPADLDDGGAGAGAGGLEVDDADQRRGQ